MSSHADELNCNSSNNEHFNEVVERSLKQPARRGFLRGTVGLGAAAALPVLPACGGSDSGTSAASLSFNAVEKSLDDIVKVPAGYVVQVVHATGDPLDTNLAAYSNLGSETDDWSRRIGDHHDGMDLFYVDANGKYSEADTGRAVLAVNHESSADAHFFHPKGQTSGGVNGKKFSQFGDWDLLARPADGLEVLKEINHHGVSIVELSKTGTTWSYKKDSAFNRRVTGQTPVSIAGPAAHLSDIKALMVTAYDTTGAMARGTLNNCGHGKTPWAPTSVARKTGPPILGCPRTRSCRTPRWSRPGLVMAWFVRLKPALLADRRAGIPWAMSPSTRAGMSLPQGPRPPTTTAMSRIPSATTSRLIR